MTEQERLLAWMEANNYTVWSLGEKLGFRSRVAIYRLLRRQNLSPNFKLRFIERFGIEAANEIFDPLTTELESEPA